MRRLSNRSERSASDPELPSATPPTLAGRGEPQARILILTAPVGEGHLAAARTLALSLAQTDSHVETHVCDVLPFLPRLLRRTFADLYRWQLRSAPWLFGLLFATLRRSRTLRIPANLVLASLGSPALRRLVRQHAPDIVVSTYPPLTTILGSLRRRGRLTVPVCATITDFAGLEFWTHRGVDLHLVMHDSLVPAVERLAGRDSAKRSAPLVAPEFLQARTSAEARHSLCLPPDRPVIVVSGGGWAVGDIEGAISTALNVEDAFVVGLAGRDEAKLARLQRAFGSNRRVVVLGFTNEMSDLLAAADVLVHSTGGVTCLEALARECPIVAYGAPPGHAPLLAKTMESLGLLRRAASRHELLTALRAALAAGISTTLDQRGPSAASLILSIQARAGSRRSAKITAVRGAAFASAAITASVCASLAFPIAARALDVGPTTSLPTTQQEIGLVVRAAQPTPQLVTALVTTPGLHASLAVAERLTRQEARLLRPSHVVPLPTLRSGELTGWVETKEQLERDGSRRLGRHFFYLAPDAGLTIGQYLLARDIGGRPVAAAIRIDRHARRISARAGQIVVLTLPADPKAATALIRSTLQTLRASGLQPVSVPELAASSRA